MRPIALAALLAGVTISTAALAAPPPRMETRWPGVHLVGYDDLNLKSVVAEFDRFLTVVEVPHDDATARSLLGLLREKFPGKPRRFAFHMHHHDHSLGALDPLLASGVTLVTTPWNLEQVKKLASDPAALESRTVTVRDELSLADSTNALRTWVLSKEKYELPADPYVVVEFPRAKILVSDCLFNKPLTYFEVVNARKRSLDRFLADAKLEVEWLVPTNSAHGSGFEDVCERSVVTETLEKGIEPEEVADRLQARPVEQLCREIDALAAEFRAKSPRSYDILVCGNYLELKRQDNERAAILFEVAERLYPSELDPPRFLGESLSLAGEKAKAREAWKGAIQIATKEEDRQEIREALEKLEE